jgi:hypothetical protein
VRELLLPGEVPRARARRLFNVTTDKGGFFIETRPGMDEIQARALARRMEIDTPSLRTARAKAPGELLNDDAPLDVGFDEPSHPVERERRQVGVPAVRRRLLREEAQELGGDRRELPEVVPRPRRAGEEIDGVWPVSPRM